MRNDRNGSPYAVFGVANNRTHRDPETGVETPEVDWYNVRLYGRSAATVAEYCAAGTPIQIHGRLEHRRYTNQQNQPAYSLDVHAHDFDFVPATRRRDDDRTDHAATTDVPDDQPKQLPDADSDRFSNESPNVTIGTFPANV